MRWVHSTELTDPTPWLKGGELLLTTGIQLDGPKAQRELIDRLADHEIAGLGFGTGFTPQETAGGARDGGAQARVPAVRGSLRAAVHRDHRARVRAAASNERYEMLQRNMVGDVLAEALTGHLYPEELQARLRPFGIGEQVAVLAFSTPDPTAAAAALERMPRARGRAQPRRDPRRPAVRGDRRGLVRDGRAGNGLGTGTKPGTARGWRGRDVIRSRSRASSAVSWPSASATVAAAASRVAPTHSLRLSFHEARCALEAVRLQNGDAPEVASYKDLGAFQLLLSLQDDDALISYCRGVLGPVEQGEGEYGDELLRSLDVFIEHNGHWEKAASALYCHRHTLRYRIRRVEQLTGRDFSKARDRIEFWLALRAGARARPTTEDGRRR